MYLEKCMDDPDLVYGGYHNHSCVSGMEQYILIGNK